jgi:predicted ester cyclase
VHIVREVFGAWNAHDVERYVALLDRRYVGQTHAVPTPLRGRQAARRAMQWYLETFPDLRFELDDMVSTGNDVLVSWLFTGTPQNHPSSHWPDRQLKVHGCTVSSVKNSKVLYAWDYWDTIT